MPAVPEWLINQLSDGQVRRVLEGKAMGFPLRLAVADAMGLTLDELDLYEAGMEIEDEMILDRIMAERNKVREPGE